MKRNKYFLSIIGLSALIFSSCAEFFQPRVPMDLNSSSAYLEDLLVEETKGGKLGTPTQLVVSKNRNTSEISLTWSKVKNAISYRIEYAVVSPNSDGIYPDVAPEEQFSVLENSWYDTNYTHKITHTAIPDYDNRYDKRFFYRITALNVREGFDDGDPTLPDVYGTLFAPPRNVKATAGISEDFIDLAWDPVKGASQYQIYRSENEQGAGASFIKTVEENLIRYRDDGIGPKDKGKEFYYQVKAINRGGSSSDLSSVAMGYTLVPGAPGAPNNVKVTNGRGNSSDTIILRWDAFNSQDPIKYNVFRYSSKDSSLSKVGRNLKNTEFADKNNLEPGVYYNYVVQVVKEESQPDGTIVEIKSPMSKPVEGFILSPPTNIKAKKISGGVELSWEKAIGTVEEQKNYTYKIFSSEQLDSGYTEVSSVTDDIKATVQGTGVFFKIQTINADNIASMDSEIASPAPDAAIGVKATRADYACLAGAPANEVGVYPVNITWQKPANDNPGGYYIYRSVDENDGYRKITNDPITELSYLDADETLQPGKVYYYKVLALNTLNQGENYSVSDYGWGALTHETYLKEFNETIMSSQKKLTLMHKPGSTDKLGTETKNGTISGTVYYNAAVAGLGAEITMKYTDYADFYIDPAKKELGNKFTLTGNSDTTANMSSNGNMHGTITCKGMYPGKVDYGKIEIKSGAAGGGYYGVAPEGSTSKDVVYSVLEA